MSENNTEEVSSLDKSKKSGASISIKSFIGVVIILMAIIIFVGILTFVVEPGMYERETVDGIEKIVQGSFRYIDSTTRLPIIRWFTAPFEVLFSRDGGTIIQIAAMLVILGGSFGIMEKTEGIKSMMGILVKKFSGAKTKLVWSIVLFFMLISSFFGIFDGGLILLPMILIMSTALGWDKITGLGLCVLSLGVGFTMSLTNPLTIQIASRLTGTNYLNGILYRIILFGILWVVTSIFVTKMAKTAEKNKLAQAPLEGAMQEDIIEIDAETKSKAKIFTGLLVTVLAVMIISSLIPVLQPLTLILMSASFFVGTIICGLLVTKNIKTTAKYFAGGFVAVLPAVFILMMASSVKYVAEKGNILDTFIHYFSSNLANVSPYASILVIYAIVLLFELFITSGSAKVLLLIPFLTSLGLSGLSTELIILAYMFGDGFANVFYPTNAMLLVGLSLAETSYTEWFKRTWFFQLMMAVFSVAALLIGVAIGY